MRAISYALAAACVLAGVSVSAQEAETVNKSVVRVIAFKDGKPVMTGTGFAIGDKGFVVTADHIVSAGSEVKVLKNGEAGEIAKGRTAKVVVTNTDMNFAIIEVPGLGAPGLRLAAAAPKQGATVFLVGYPGADAVNSTLTQGIVEQVAMRPAGGRNVPFVQHAARGGPGTGGGPLVNACGGVVGVNGFLLQSGAGLALAASEIAAQAKAKNVAVASAPPCAK
jgi:S1-C subfamily serine protease